ncbi:MAG: YceI family protein [Bacteroidota bacterium]
MRLGGALCFLLLQVLLGYAQQSEIAKAKITFEFPSKSVKGSIEGFQSQSQIDWDTPSNSIFRGSVKVATLDTNNGLRNWSLRGSRYFNVKNHPEISYSSRKVSTTGSSWLVDGDLTIKGITKSVQIEFDELDGKLVGKASLYSSDFGIKIKKRREDNLVNIRFEFESVR